MIARKPVHPQRKLSDIKMDDGSWKTKDPNTELNLRFRRFQQWSPTVTVVVSVLALIIIGAQAVIYLFTLDKIGQQSQALINAERGYVILDNFTIYGLEQIAH